MDNFLWWNAEMPSTLLVSFLNLCEIWLPEKGTRSLFFSSRQLKMPQKARSRPLNHQPQKVSGTFLLEWRKNCTTMVVTWFTTSKHVSFWNSASPWRYVTDNKKRNLRAGAGGTFQRPPVVLLFTMLASPLHPSLNLKPTRKIIDEETGETHNVYAQYIRQHFT